MEIWKDIIGYEGYYQISSEGNVRNTRTNTILIGDINNIGYRRVWLNSPIKKRFFIHRLVAKHFCDGYDIDKIVNHIDGNKLNNVATNLEWVTHSENDLHAFRTHLRKPHGSPFRKRIIGYDKNTLQFVKEWNNIQECCNELNVRRPNVYSCCNGKQKSCRGLILKYKE